MKNLRYLLLLLIITSFSKTNAFNIDYQNSSIKYTDSWVKIYSMDSKDFLDLWFEWQVNLIKSFSTWERISSPKISQSQSVYWTDNWDYFYDFKRFSKNNVYWWNGDDFYDIWISYNIIEETDGWNDTIFVKWNTWQPSENIENIISAWVWWRVYGNSNDNLIIQDWNARLYSKAWWNNVFILNWDRAVLVWWDWNDTVIFPWKLSDYEITWNDRNIYFKNKNNWNSFQVGIWTIEQFQFDDAFFGKEAWENTYYVWPNSSFTKVSDAIRVAWDWDTIEVESWVYEDDFSIIRDNITIKWVNWKAHFYAKSPSYKSKANFIVNNANVTFENVEFSWNKVWDKNWAWIRYEWWNLTIKNSYFHNNEVWILWWSYPNWIITIENTEFWFNWNWKKIATTLNIWKIKELNVKDSYFHNTNYGHNIRIQADKVNINDSYFYDGDSNTSYSIYLTNAWVSNIYNNTFVQTQNWENNYIIYNNNVWSSDFKNNKFINFSNKWVSPIYNVSSNSLILENNKLYNYKSFVTWNNYTDIDNNFLDTFDINLPKSNNPVWNISYNNKVFDWNISWVTSKEFTKKATIDDYKWKTITVWNWKDYSSLNEAILNANFWDKIYLDEWIYESDYSVIKNKDLAIIGLWNWAELKAVATIPNKKAIIVNNTSNLYIENIIFSDSKVPDKNWAWIRQESWTLTVKNSTFKNNENWILSSANDEWKWKIWVSDSSFFNNWKNWIWKTHSLYIWEIEYFEITNSVIKWTNVWHHVKSRARNNLIENNILDDDWENTSYNIDLPNWWNWVIKWNTIIQSQNSPNRIMISYSAEKNKPNSWELLIENNYFESKWDKLSIWVNNFKTNKVILRNNTFKNVTHEYKWDNVFVDNSWN